jgi:hypothetical protein
MGAAMAMQDADVAPTARQVAACTKASKQLDELLKKWTTMKTTGLAALNVKRTAAGQTAVTVP